MIKFSRDIYSLGKGVYMGIKFAVILGGCGFLDGAEVHESVLTLLNISASGSEYQCFAPNKPFDEVDHLTKQPTGLTRNVLSEAARIARSEIVSLDELSAENFDALVLPGGFGAAKNLCDFAVVGENCHADTEVKRIVLDFHKAKKPIGAICIAPSIIASVLGENNVELTIGSDKGTAEKLEKMGAVHVDKNAVEAHVDPVNRIVSTPAYMCAKNIVEVNGGIKVLVGAIIDMVGQ